VRGRFPLMACAPERTLVAVRAMAPVAGMPPNSGTTKFAVPCATNSTFGSCCVPLMPSPTTAESRLSMAPSSATVSADGSSIGIQSAWNSGM
jgi:hypothetical protein